MVYTSRNKFCITKVVTPFLLYLQMLLSFNEALSEKSINLTLLNFCLYCFFSLASPSFHSRNTIQSWELSEGFVSTLPYVKCFCYFMTALTVVVQKHRHIIHKWPTVTVATMHTEKLHVVILV